MTNVNIITDSGVVTISFYKELARNPEIGNPQIIKIINVSYHYGLELHISFRYTQTKTWLEKINDLHH